eukprot:9011118-Pyramimonas_sp.AAC.1
MMRAGAEMRHAMYVVSGVFITMGTFVRTRVIYFSSHPRPDKGQERSRSRFTEKELARTLTCIMAGTLT